MLIPLYAGPQTWPDEVAAVEAAFERSGVKPKWPADEAGNIGPMAEAMADEIASLREAIRRLADQDATLSVQGGGVTVTLDATLTDEEREAVEFFAELRGGDFDSCLPRAATLRNLLERTK
jgi:hypothetical protein